MKHTLTFLIALLLAPSGALFAGGVQSVTLPAVTPAARPITVDGSLDDWGGEAFRYLPLPTDGLLTTGEPVPSLLQVERRVDIRVAYTTEALFVALDWRDPKPGHNSTPVGAGERWSAGGAGMELHLRADRVVHVASWPLEGGKRAALMVRTGAEKTWIDATAKGGAAAITVQPGQGAWSQELRIPWQLVTADGKVSAEPLPVVIDLAWSDLTTAAQNTLPVTLLRGATHFTGNLLTAPGKVHSRGYLGRSADWGELVFGGDAAPARPVTTDPGTALTSLAVRKVATPPAVDGTLTGWQGIPFVDFSILPGYVGGRFAGGLAAAYDSASLYIAMRIDSPLPPRNPMPEHSQAGFHGGDCLQVRLGNDAWKVNLCAWLDSTAGKPALTADGSDLPNGFLQKQGARIAIKTDPRGGYVMEIAVPWQALRGAAGAPADGERWRGTFQPWWAGIDPRFALEGTLRFEKQGTVALNVTIPADGEVSLGLYDRQGGLLRTLLRQEFRPTGNTMVPWDGLDQWGNPLPAGDYQLKGIHHPPLSAEHQLTFGNPGNPPWPTADGKGDWLSDESSPQAAVTDGEWVYLAAPGSEKGFAIIAVDGNGQRQWGVNYEVYPRCVSLALDGEFLYALFSGPELTDQRGFTGKNAVGRALLNCFDKRTGRATAFSVQKSRLKVATWPYREEVFPLWDLRTQKKFSPATYAGQPRYFCNDIGESCNALGLAAQNGKVYVSLFYEDKLLVLDGATAEKTGEIEVEKPVGLHATPAGILAVSRESVKLVDPGTKQAKTLIAKKLLAPHSVTTDRAGNVYVSDWGTSFQVKVFSPKGEFLRAIGKEGGRPWLGKWEAGGMLVPRGIAVTDDGRLWVAEDDTAPKRISVWDAQSGAFLRDYIGPAPYGGGCVFFLDPKNKDIGVTLGTRFAIDGSKKTWTPLATVGRRMSRDQPFAINGHGCMASGQKVMYKDGKEYVAANGYHMMIILRRDGEVYTPVAAAGGLSRLTTGDGAARDVWDSDIGHHSYKNWYPDCFRGHAGDNFSWCDENNDGLVQPEEMRWVKTLSRGDVYAAGRQAEWMTFWGAGIAPDWSIYFSSFCRDAQITFRLDPAGWTAAGAPRFEISTAQEIIRTDKPNSINGLYVNAENKLFISYRYEIPENAKRGADALACFTRDGKPLWRLAMANPQMKHDIQAENVTGEFTIPGLGNVLGTWLWHGNCRPYLVTSDGLYLGTLQEDTLLGPLATWGESFRYYYQAPDGTPYLVNGANDAHHFLRIKGLEKGGRIEQTVTVTPEMVRLAAAQRAAPQVEAAPKPVLRVTWPAAAPKVDGALDDWNLDAGVALDGGKGRMAQVALARDADTLYLAYRVDDDTPLVNLGENWQTLFISGDCVDLMLAANPKADPNRRQPAAGDQRLLFGVFHNEPIAVRYRPVAPGAKNPATLMAARLDEIVKLSSAKVAVHRGDRYYTVEAAVPFKELGLDPKLVKGLRGDVGVIYSDETGRNRSLRLYYYNRKTEMIADLTTEATLQPAEWGTIDLPLGRNLLKNGSFEQPFAGTSTDGWKVELTRNGATAEIVSGVAHSGKQSLCISQPEPVTFPAAAYDLPSTLPGWKEFVARANDGKGAGHAFVSQSVPVTAGKKYIVRFWYRSTDVRPEIRQAKNPDRGYTLGAVTLLWGGAKRDHSVGLIGIRDNEAEWREQVNQRTHTVTSEHLVAPEGSTTAIFSFKFTCCIAKYKPQIWVDDVELVEVE